MHMHVHVPLLAISSPSRALNLLLTNLLTHLLACLLTYLLAEEGAQLALPLPTLAACSTLPILHHPLRRLLHGTIRLHRPIHTTDAHPHAHPHSHPHARDSGLERLALVRKGRCRLRVGRG